MVLNGEAGSKLLDIQMKKSKARALFEVHSRNKHRFCICMVSILGLNPRAPTTDRRSLRTTETEGLPTARNLYRIAGAQVLHRTNQAIQYPILRYLISIANHHNTLIKCSIESPESVQNGETIPHARPPIRKEEPGHGQAPEMSVTHPHTNSILN